MKIIQNKSYCKSLTNYSRNKTREVKIGKIPLGDKNPIRIQSMANTDTLDTSTTVEQCKRIFDAGADYIRITTPRVKDAENLANIKTQLHDAGYTNPLIADIHFNPKAAETAAQIVEKVRINPGNYVDKKSLNQIKFTEEAYQQEIEKIRLRLIPLLTICKENQTAVRIGTNHGSLSGRIMNRYGDTPLGMVESTMEFLRICQSENFNDIVISLKSSNTRVMVQACRLLVKAMKNENMNYPLHLGVTEAGEGEDGRIKSALGMGALLADGIGDTIRISLTEAPEKEIPVAITIAEHFKDKTQKQSLPEIDNFFVNPYQFEKRKTRQVSNIGSENEPVVVADLSNYENITARELEKCGYTVNDKNQQWEPGDTPADYIFVRNSNMLCYFPKQLKIICPYKDWQNSVKDNPQFVPLFSAKQYLNTKEISTINNFVEINYAELNNELLKKLKADPFAVLVIESITGYVTGEQRYIFQQLHESGCDIPVILRFHYKEKQIENFKLKSAADAGGAFIDGLGDGIWLENFFLLPAEEIVSASFGILQAARLRISKTEYISCPSCGRTLFDLEKVTQKIRSRTSHLKGLKIGIMGCIVNGPGEMADADYGYVGMKKGKINLYKGQKVMKKNIPAGDAVDELIKLIKEHGDWKEKS